MIRIASLPRLLLPLILAGATLALRAADAPFQPKAEHVLLVIWDGMRPDFINAQNTPNLQALLERGTFFANNHSFWPTTTEVNGTVLATGAFPARSHVVANQEYRPDINPRGPVHTEDAETMRKGDELTGGKYLGVKTVAEVAHQAGQSTVVAGTKPVALIQDRAPERPAQPRSATLFAGKTYPAALLDAIVAALGPNPPYKPDPTHPGPNTDENNWTTHALLEHLWHDGVPRYSVLWLSDPDFPQHVSSPGAPAALTGIHDSDTNLGLVVADLTKRGLLDKTDIFVVSDHGFSTIGRSVDPVKYYNEHGVTVSKQFASPPANGQVMSVSVGGATGLYVIGHDAPTIAKLVDLLQQSDFAGPIFTRDALPGTFAINAAHLDSPAAPDIIFSFRWNDGANAVGAPGLITAEGKAGLGMHGSLSKFDIHNTLVAGGPDIRAGYRDEFPTGNIDVAPTILHLLGLTSPNGVDGRVLTEALADTPLLTEKPVTKRLEASKDTHTWQQYLQTTSFAGRTYFDEGNASSASH
ncbi:MAG: alkaline phosphatase family protein [Chthoniobacter sp.]|uniref:alkaline phosphatase family protein n=1 Tax=Chthoniobacter sp. TaxID=2510640 RepID=UPI0032A3B564